MSKDGENQRGRVLMIKESNRLETTWRIKLEFKKHDCWLGCYWTMHHRDLHIYICLIPCLPIHIIKFNHDKGDYSH